MPKRKSALTKGKMIAGRFLLFLVLFLFFCRVQCGPLGLFLGLRVQILLRLLFLGSPRPPFPHERGWNTRFSLWGVSRSGGISETGQGRAGGPGVRGARGRPGRSCGFCLFPSLRLRDFSPSWDPGAVCSVLSVRFSAGGRGKGDGQKGKPHYRSYSKGEKPPPWARALFSPRLIGNYNLEGFCFSSRLLGRRRAAFPPVSQSQLSSLRTPPGSSFSSFFLLVFLCCRRCLHHLCRRRHCLRCPGPAAAAESFSSGPSRVK